MSGKSEGPDRKKLMAAAKADIFAVLKANRIRADERADISGTVWRLRRGKKGPAGLFERGSILEYLIEFEGMQLQAALEMALKTAAPDMTGERRVRMVPRERLLAVKRGEEIAGLASSLMEGRPASDAPILPREDPGRAAAAIRGLAERFRLNKTLLESLFATGHVYASGRTQTVFVSRNEKKAPAWGFVLSYRKSLTSGNAGENAASFSQFPWVWGNEASDTVRVFANPVEAAACLTLSLRRETLSALREKQAWLSLTGDCLGNGQEGLYSYLAQRPAVKNIILSLENLDECRTLAEEMKSQLGSFGFSFREEPPGPEFMSWLSQGMGSTFVPIAAEDGQCVLEIPA